MTITVLMESVLLFERRGMKVTKGRDDDLQPLGGHPAVSRRVGPAEFLE
jgi:hypothetical protein